MNPFEGVVLYAVYWFLTVFVVLPIGLRTQGDEGEIVPGTQAGAPANYSVKRMMWRVTVVATVLWGITALVLIYGGITVRDIDMFGRMGPPQP